VLFQIITEREERAYIAISARHQGRRAIRWVVARRAA
jgi:hypothetical protein